jgi:hypothetical protein
MSQCENCSDSFNEQWLEWTDKNDHLTSLIDAFPSIMEANEVDETSLDIDEYYDLVDTMILALRLPEWSKILDYMRSPNTYSQEIESVLDRLDSQLDSEGLTEMEHILAIQMYDQHLYETE